VIRRAETESELGACVEIFNAVDADVRLAIGDLRDAQGPVFLHEGGGYLYLADSTVQRRAYSMVRVRPEARRRGIGTALLEVAREEARRMGKDGIWGRVECDDQESRGWLLRRGFRETLQDVELIRQVESGDGEVAENVALLGPQHLAGAYAVEVECVPDVPSTAPMRAEPFERWRERIAKHAVTVVALDEERVVGYATAEALHGMPHRLEHGLTAVLRSHRGRGIATRLKNAQIAWAAARGYTELVTHTDTTNLATRRVNTKLGYAERLGPIVVEREL